MIYSFPSVVIKDEERYSIIIPDINRVVYGKTPYDTIIYASQAAYDSVRMRTARGELIAMSDSIAAEIVEKYKCTGDLYVTNVIVDIECGRPVTY